MAISRATSTSPSAPALSSPRMSSTSTLPGGMSSMVPCRWLAGLAMLARSVKSSRTGTKRRVQAGPASRQRAGLTGRTPWTARERRPAILSSWAVMVAVLIRPRISSVPSASSVMAACSRSAMGKGGRRQVRVNVQKLAIAQPTPLALTFSQKSRA